MAAKDWEVFIGAPPKDVAPRRQPEDLLGYFSRYVYRTAITNQRLLKVEDGKVTFEYYDNRERDGAPSGHPQGRKKVMTLPAVEFIRRFLRHVLPFDYKRVRHFGLYAGSKLRLQAVRMILGASFDFTQSTPPKLDMGDWLASLGLDDALRCPFCGEGTLRLGRDFAPLGPFQLWFLALLGIAVFGKEAA